MLARPAVLGRDPRLKSLADVDAALHELGWIRARREVLAAEAEAEIAALKERLAERLACEIEGETVSLAERADQLERALAVWAERQLSRHLPAGRKSLDLAHGRIGITETPPAVGFRRRCDAASVLAAVERKFHLTSLLDRVLAATWGPLTAGDIVRLRTELNKPRIKDAWRGGRERQQALQALGLQVESSSQYVIEPARVELAAPAG
jgi:phage host-nuclease inhibitor protein Gam